MLPERFGRKPVHLFVFTRQHLVWRYCTADRDIEVDGKVYLSAQIERSAIEQTIERAKDKLSIKFAYLLDPDAAEYPVTQSLGDNWFPYAPHDTIGVVCMEFDAGIGAIPNVEWIGVVIQPRFGDAEIELTCEPGNGYNRARGQGACWQRTCGKTPYSTGLRGCNLDRAVLQVSGELSAASSQWLSAPAFGDSAFTLAGGFLTWTAANGLLMRREVAAHEQGSSQLVLVPGGPSPATGDAVIALPTCPRTWDACAARGNTDNYGGSLFKPVKNPVDGVSMSWG